MERNGRLARSRTLGKRPKRLRSSRCPTSLRVCSYVDHDSETTTAEPVLKLKRRWATSVSGRLARPIDDRSHACLIRQHIREIKSVERTTQVVVRLVRLTVSAEVGSTTAVRSARRENGDAADCHGDSERAPSGRWLRVNLDSRAAVAVSQPRGSLLGSRPSAGLRRRTRKPAGAGLLASTRRWRVT
jgi:hypothetical protein